MENKALIFHFKRKSIVVSKTFEIVETAVATSWSHGILQKMPLPKASQPPINSYCKTKLFMKRMLNDFARAHSISWIDLRYFNAASGAPDGETGEPTIPRCIFFPALSWRWTASLPIFTSWMITLSTPDGTCIRNCIHIRDLASATSKPWSLVNGGLGERIAINLGTGQASP